VQSLSTPFGPDRLVQQVRLSPTGTPVLFALPGLVSFSPGRDVQQFSYGRVDDVIQLRDPLYRRLQLHRRLHRQDRVAAPPEAAPAQPAAGSSLTRWFGRREADRDAPRGAYPVPKEVTEFALRDDVAAVDAKGNLGRQRLAAGDVGPLDEQVARNIERYLQTQFTYTLDLTEAAGWRTRTRWCSSSTTSRRATASTSPAR
jgi:hypothetical protein